MNNHCDEFKTVSYKRKGRIKKTDPKVTLNDLSETPNFDKEKLINSIQNSKVQVFDSEYFESVQALLREGLESLKKTEIEEIICLGLGRISQDFIARSQLGLLLCLRDLYRVKISAYDPVFGDTDAVLLNNFEIEVLEENTEGKFKVGNKVTLFFMPHCPKQLSNNLLYANWGLNLKNCVIFANSFTRIVEGTNKNNLERNGEYILNIYPHTLELTTVNNFKYNQVFNDFALHFFPIDKLRLLTKEFWEGSKEPQYSEVDLEFVQKIKI